MCVGGIWVSDGVLVCSERLERYVCRCEWGLLNQAPAKEANTDLCCSHMEMFGIMEILML